MLNIDLRLSNQRVEHFYIWRGVGGYTVGVNGTAIHSCFLKSDYKNLADLKNAIKSFIYANFIVKK